MQAQAAEVARNAHRETQVDKACEWLRTAQPEVQQALIKVMICHGFEPAKTNLGPERG